MKATVSAHTSQTDSFIYRFHSGEYQMLNGNGTDFDLSNIIDFDNGIPGFEELSKFIILPLKEYPPFLVFQSLEAPPIAMFVIPIHYFIGSKLSCIFFLILIFLLLYKHISYHNTHTQ